MDKAVYSEDHRDATLYSRAVTRKRMQLNSPCSSTQPISTDEGTRKPPEER